MDVGTMNTDLTLTAPSPSPAPKRPNMPPSLARLVSAMPAVTVGSTIPGWRVPKAVTRETRAQAAVALTDYDLWFKAAGREAVLKCVLVLLSFYYTPAQDEGVATLAASAWADDLAVYPLWAVQAACDDWRHTSDRRPTPTQILTRCADMVFEDRKAVQRLEKLAEAPEGSCSEIPSNSAPKPGHQQRVSDMVAGCVAKLAVAEPAVKAREPSKRKRPPVSWEEERRLNQEALETDTMKAATARS